MVTAFIFRPNLMHNQTKFRGEGFTTGIATIQSEPTHKRFFWITRCFSTRFVPRRWNTFGEKRTPDDIEFDFQKFFVYPTVQKKLFKIGTGKISNMLKIIMVPESNKIIVKMSKPWISTVLAGSSDGI